MKDFENYIWRGKKNIVDGVCVQDERKLIDMSQNELQDCIDHCYSMLYNNDKDNLGRVLLLDLIKEQKDKCGTELYLRDLTKNNTITRFSFMETLNLFVSNNKEVLKDIPVPTIKLIQSDCNPNYENLPIKYILAGCFDRLGTFSKKYITLSFIIKQGVWLNKQEFKTFMEKDTNGNTMSKSDSIKKRLDINTKIKLIFNPKGLTYHQFRAMINLPNSIKYSDLTTIQLDTLRYRVLPALEFNTNFHISKWKELISQIKEVANYKNFNLDYGKDRETEVRDRVVEEEQV